MISKTEHLFNFELLQELLLLSKKINIDTSKEQVEAVYLEWLAKNREFRIQASRLTDEQKVNFNKYVLEKVSDEKSKDDDLFIFNSVQFYLRDFLMKEIENKKEEKDIELKKEEKKLTPLNFNDFMTKVDKKSYYVKGMFASGTINMIFSPPKQMKSFVSYYLALCMAQGVPFLNQKCKKVNVCYFDWENPIGDVQNRIKGICKGMNFNTENIDNFFLFPKQPTLIKVDRNDSYVYDDLKEQLLNFIRDNEIKVIFFDTFRRLGNFDENDSQTINTIKSELFDPLIKETNICIIFLHHTSKEGKTYRGSVDIEGILDTSFKITKKETDVNLKIVMSCDARRNNEIEQLTSIVEIENEEVQDEDGDMYENIVSVSFNRTLDEEEETGKDYNAYRGFFIDNLELGVEYRNKELLEMIEYNFNIKSAKTMNEILGWCSYSVNPRVLLKTGKGKATRYEINPELKQFIETSNFVDKDKTSEVIENYLHKVFREADQIQYSVLVKDDSKGWGGLFSLDRISVVIDKWNKKGWINTAKKDFICVTDLYRGENK